MKDLKQLSDQNLLELTQKMVKVERETSLTILELLLEVERRRLFAAQGFSSLFNYCTTGLGFTEAEALRRISSMRLIRNLASESTPNEATKVVQEIEAKVESGSLSLSVLSQAQSFFQQEAKAGNALDVEEKKEVLNSLEGKSTRDAARELLNRSSQELPPVVETTRPLPGNKTEIKMVVDQDTLEALQKLKGLLAHKHPRLGWGELVGILAKIGMEKLDPAREPRRATSKARSEAEQSPVARKVDGALDQIKAKNLRVAIPAALKRQVWQTVGRACTFVDPVTGRKCCSDFCLEIEHIVPVACGGLNILSNLTVHCKAHNQYRAIQKFSLKFMEPYLNSSKKI